MDFMIQDVYPLLAAAILGGLVGVERQMVGHGAGLRTHMMVAMASAIFIVASRGITDQSSVDLTRVIQGIAAGVGFIGAGSILKLGTQHEVLGLTTASTIWLSAAVGTACGLKEYSLAAVAAVLTVLVLVILRPFENRFGSKAKGSHSKTSESQVGGAARDEVED